MYYILYLLAINIYKIKKITFPCTQFYCRDAVSCTLYKKHIIIYLPKLFSFYCFLSTSNIQLNFVNNSLYKYNRYILVI